MPFPDNVMRTGNTTAPDIQAEYVVPAVIGQYVCDFNRMVTSHIGNIAGSFSQIKLGTFYHTIRRVDTGSAVGMVMFTSEAPVPDPPSYMSPPSLFSPNTRANPLVIKYRILSRNQSTAGNWTQQRMEMLPGLKSKLLMPGRKLVWRFNARTYNTKQITNCVRDYNGEVGGSNMGTTEDVSMITMNLPSGSQRLGWIPMGVMCPIENYDHDADFTDGIAGSATGSKGGVDTTTNQGVPRILGPTVLFYFTMHGQAEFGTTTRKQHAPGGPTMSLNYYPCVSPLIRRTETLKVWCKGLQRQALTRVGQAIQQIEYPMQDAVGLLARAENLVLPSTVHTSYPPLGAEAAIDRGVDDQTLYIQTQTFTAPPQGTGGIVDPAN